jgi:hypothetical protein
VLGSLNLCRGASSSYSDMESCISVDMAMRGPPAGPGPTRGIDTERETYEGLGYYGSPSIVADIVCD